MSDWSTLGQSMYHVWLLIGRQNKTYTHYDQTLKTNVSIRFYERFSNIGQSKSIQEDLVFILFLDPLSQAIVKGYNKQSNQKERNPESITTSCGLHVASQVHIMCKDKRQQKKEMCIAQWVYSEKGKWEKKKK